jgi:hypothetical protein
LQYCCESSLVALTYPLVLPFMLCLAHRIADTPDPAD